jgi:type II secretory pathway pseudopilin PulG
MRPASRRPQRPALTPATAGFSLTPAHAGFSLTEALVAAVVLGIALVGSSGALRGITDLLGRSGQVNAMNLAIDNDISEIKRLASLYTACLVPTGSIPVGADAGCGQGLSPDQAAYFFPVNPGTNEANITAFFAACSAASAGSHITQGFITAIGQLPAVGAGVSRSSVEREAPTDARNHNVIVRYSAPNGPMQRMIKVAPVVAAWCN